jgi:hypothetical protein
MRPIRIGYDGRRCNLRHRPSSDETAEEDFPVSIIGLLASTSNSGAYWTRQLALIPLFPEGFVGTNWQCDFHRMCRVVDLIQARVLDRAGSD